MKVTSILLITLIAMLAYGAEFSICTGTGNQKMPDVAFDGTNYMVVYDSVGSIWVAQIDVNGAILGKMILHQSTQDRNPAITAGNAGRCFVVWNNGTGVMRAIIQGLNIVVSPANTPWAVDPDICRVGVGFNGTYYLLVRWTIGDASLQGMFYDTDGNGSSEFSIDYSNNNYGYGNAMVVSNGTNFIVSYPIAALNEYRYGVKYGLVTPNPPNPPTINTFFLKNYVSGGAIPADLLIRYPPSVAYNGVEYFCCYHWYEMPIGANEIHNLYGARIRPSDGYLYENDILISTDPNINEYASAITDEDRNYLIVWQDNTAGATNYNIYGRHFDQYGDPLTSEITVVSASYDQTVPKIAGELNNLVVWQDYRSNTNWDIYGNLMAKTFTTDDALALAYNGNRHLARKPNTNEFHIVYTDRGKVIYRYSSNEGVDWTPQFVVGNGKLPSIALDPNGLAYVAWTDDAGGLWFRYQPSAYRWNPIYHLYDPGANDPKLNSPPSIGLVVNRGVVYPHILVTRTDANNDRHLVEDFTFPVTNPGSGTFDLVEVRYAPDDPPLRTFPSIVKDDYDSLHAVWQRTDTIAYATRYRIGGSWVVWGAVLGIEGRQSAHPFSETYGNKAYIAWQSNYPYGIEEAYRADRSIGSSLWAKYNMSLTSETKSIYSVNASGFFTVFADEYDSPWDIYYVVSPHDPFYNISQTSGITSQYPHSVAKFIEVSDTKYLYTVWLEGNSSPYEIRFKKITHNPSLEFAYLSTTTGHNPASPYLIARDGYIDNWQIPVDFGYSTITYRLPLLPEFKYKLKTIAYHQGSGEWREWVIIDGQVQHLAKYNPYEPEIIEFMVPPAFYQDSVIEVVFERVEGDFATGGPIDIYRYEYEESEGGGPQDVATRTLNNGRLLLNVYPNPVRKEFTIEYALQQETMINLSIYDATGRLINVLANEVQKPGSYQRTLQSSNLAQGIYFIQLNTVDQFVVQKIIFLR